VTVFGADLKSYWGGSRRERWGKKNLYLAHPQHTTTLLATFLNILLGLLANTNLNNVFILNQNNTVVQCIT
jgi:hypothetical protein